MKEGTLWFWPDNVYENRFWNRRPDGIVINKKHQTLYIVEFKRSSNSNQDFLRVKKDEADEQHNSIIEALEVAAPEIPGMDFWTDQFCGREAWCSSGKWILWQARKAQCTSKEKGQDSGGACATYIRSAWHSNVMWCERCLLITKSPDAPCHYRYLNLGPLLHPLSGIEWCSVLRLLVFLPILRLQIMSVFWTLLE